MAPVWEANHVWLIFVLVVTWTAYPTAFGSIASTLAVALFVAAVGIIMRGTAYAMRSGAPPDRESEGVIGFVFGASSMLTPFALGAAIGAIASGRVPVGNAAGRPRHELAEPDLDHDRRPRRGDVRLPRGRLPRRRRDPLGEQELARAFRARALVMGVRSGRAGHRRPGRAARRRPRALRRPDERGRDRRGARVRRAREWRRSRSCARRRYEPARVSAALAVAAIVAGWGIAQSPDILPGLTVHDAAAGHATLVALLISIAAGLVILVPSLVLLFGLVLRGRFDPAAPAVADATGAAARRAATARRRSRSACSSSARR